MTGGDDSEFWKQFVSCEKKAWLIAGRFGGKAWSKQADNFTMGKRRNGAGHIPIKKMARLYNVSLDDLIEFDIELADIQEIIDRTSEADEEKINWTNAWGKKYPVLLKYRSSVNISNYAYRINIILDELKREYNFNEQDAMLVLKDILYNVWKERKNIKNS